MDDETLYDSEGNVYERKGNNWYEPKWDVWSQRNEQANVKNDLEFNHTATNFDGIRLFRKQPAPEQNKQSPDISNKQIASALGGVFSIIAWVVGKLFQPSSGKAERPEITYFSEHGVLITSNRVIVKKDEFITRDISLMSPPRWSGSKYELLLCIDSRKITYVISSKSEDYINRIEAAIKKAVQL